MVPPDFDQAFWDRRWSEALEEHGDEIAQMPANPHLTTIAAGLALSDTRMILSGALPAALLALAVDWVLGRVERAVTVLTSVSPRR